MLFIHLCVIYYTVNRERLVLFIHLCVIYYTVNRERLVLFIHLWVIYYTVNRQCRDDIHLNTGHTTIDWIRRTRDIWQLWKITTLLTGAIDTTLATQPWHDMWNISDTIDGSTARRCTAIATDENARFGSVRNKPRSASHSVVVQRYHSPRPRQCWHNCGITARVHRPGHRHYYFNREVSYWLQHSATGSKCCGTTAILTTWYEIDSLTEVYYLFTSCHGSGHMLDPSIVSLVT